MLTAEQARKKVYELGEYFNHYYRQGEWWRAKHAYDTATTITVFMEFPLEDRIALYGNRAYKDYDDPQTTGLFSEEKLLKAQLECIKRNQTTEREISRLISGEKITEQKTGR